MRFVLQACFAALITGMSPALARDATEPEASLSAAEEGAGTRETEPPIGSVGRLAIVSGNVDLRNSRDSKSWTDGEPNHPIFTGVALRTDPQALAAIEIGRNTIDVSNGSQVEIVSLTGQVTQVAVSRGRINLHLRQLGEKESVEIDTAWGGVWLLKAGRYDIDAGGGDQALRIAVFAGGARFVGSGSDTRIGAGDMAIVTGSGPSVAAIEPAVPDAFAEWCRTHDYDETRLASPYYMSSEMTGFAELDGAGSWKIDPEYGAVWVPTAPMEWAPYRFGHWSWIMPWGWTWIDDRTWAFAPSHYGRWALIDDHWAWVPGDPVANPAYAPAVVAFLGTPGVGLSFEDGAAVGWFPLAPGEAYRPSYTRDVNFIRSLNRGNVDDVNSIAMQGDGEPPLEVFNGEFANRQFATVVPRSVFINARPVAPAFLTLPERRLQNAPVLMGSPQIPPPSLQQVVRAAPANEQGGRKVARGNRLAPRVSETGRAKSARSASTRRHADRQPSVIRGPHRRASTHAESSRAGRVIVLRVSYPAQAGAQKASHQRRRGAEKKR